MDQLRFLIDRLRGRETVVDVRLLGQPLRLVIASRREIRRARDLDEERALVQRMVEHLWPGDIVYDVGANIGLISLALAHHPRGATARLHAFEPEPANFVQLERNIELNGLTDRIAPHRLALGDGEGEVDLFVRAGAGEGRHSIASTAKSTGSIRVPLTTVSAFARASGEPPQVLKIDVEGAEGRVLAGMEELIREHRPRELFLEIHPKGDGDRMPGGQRIHDWLGRRGFSLAWERPCGSRLHRHYR